MKAATVSPPVVPLLAGLVGAGLEAATLEPAAPGCSLSLSRLPPLTRSCCPLPGPKTRKASWLRSQHRPHFSSGCLVPPQTLQDIPHCSAETAKLMPFFFQNHLRIITESWLCYNK